MLGEFYEKRLLSLILMLVAIMAMAVTVKASSDKPSMKIIFLNVKHGDATVEVIADGRNAKSVSTSKSKEVISNNSSLVVKVTCAGKSALFTGDARSEVEDKLPKSKVKSYFVLKIESVIQHLQKHHVIILIKTANHLKVLKTNIN